MTNQELFDLLYTQTQDIAEKEGLREYKALSQKERRYVLKTHGFFYSHNAKWWSNLFQDWASGKIDEETIRGHILNYKVGRFYYPV